MKWYVALVLVSIYLPFIAAGAAPTSTVSVGRIITLADDGKTIALQVNETFLLKLGEEYDWNVTVDDQTVLSHVVNVPVIRGTQGIYGAHKPGRAILTAVGDPVCRKMTPPCAVPSRQFRLSVDVVGAATPGAPAFEVALTISALLAALVTGRR